jgi:hypothetical protein
MTKKKVTVELIGGIQPDKIYRTTLSPVIFGYGPQATRDKIRKGELPPPFPLSESARFEAWTGKQIIEHREKMRVLAKRRVAATRKTEAASDKVRA